MSLIICVVVHVITHSNRTDYTLLDSWNRESQRDSTALYVPVSNLSFVHTCFRCSWNPPNLNRKLKTSVCPRISQIGHSGAMSLPGIRPALLERGGDGRAWGGGSHFSGDASKSQQTHSFWSNKAGVEATHAQGSSGLESQDSTDEHEGGDAVAAEAGIASSIRMKRSKPVKWSIEEDRRLRDAVSKVGSIVKKSKGGGISSSITCEICTVFFAVSTTLSRTHRLSFPLPAQRLFKFFINLKQ